ncbi:hypothetical protein NSA56_01450 [Oceanobacillus caeni]|uniref:DUF7210 family protein n=1 Tax=Oceanobacillus caeni TaxID=405946 RepID=UPI002149B43D|nr:hypothetical protein [Oceanobacillus caeni]MCR1833061.1 hypothetical protein [Oceanobacillus caeni]
MPKYIANAYLVHKGKIIQTGNEVELTKEQAKRLGDKVTPVNEPKEEEPKKDSKAKKETK